MKSNRIKEEKILYVRRRITFPTLVEVSWPLNIAILSHNTDFRFLLSISFKHFFFSMFLADFFFVIASNCSLEHVNNQNVPINWSCRCPNVSNSYGKYTWHLFQTGFVSYRIIDIWLLKNGFTFCGLYLYHLTFFFFFLWMLLYVISYLYVEIYLLEYCMCEFAYRIIVIISRATYHSI